MPTINQLIRNGRKPKRYRTRTRAFKTKEGNCPQKRGTILKCYIVGPKKPNSANRCVCRVRLSSGTEVIAYIPGQGHQLNEHATVLLEGGRVRDLPGVKYRVVRGAKISDDRVGETRTRVNMQEGWKRRKKRSKYGWSDSKKKNAKIKG